MFKAKLKSSSNGYKTLVGEQETLLSPCPPPTLDHLMSSEIAVAFEPGCENGSFSRWAIVFLLYEKKNI